MDHGGKIFISHARNDTKLALMIKKLLRKRFPKGSKPTLDIFCSSDIRDIEGGKQWFAAIMKALRESRVCISLLTPHSIFRPWVLFETGGAHTRSIAKPNRLRMFPVCAYGITPSALPGPLKQIQVRLLADRDQIAQLCAEVSKILGRTPADPPKADVVQLCKEVNRDPKHWENVHQAFVGERLDASPFSADGLLTTACWNLWRPTPTHVQLQLSLDTAGSFRVRQVTPPKPLSFWKRRMT